MAGTSKPRWRLTETTPATNASTAAPTLTDCRSMMLSRANALLQHAAVTSFRVAMTTHQPHC